MISSPVERGFFAESVIQIGPRLPRLSREPIDVVFMGRQNAFAPEQVEGRKPSSLYEGADFGRMSKVGM